MSYYINKTKSNRFFLTGKNNIISLGGHLYHPSISRLLIGYEFHTVLYFKPANPNMGEQIAKIDETVDIKLQFPEYYV